MIVVTGATGGLGSQVVEHLLRLVPAAQIAASTRRPDQATHLTDRGVRVRKGDFDDLGSLLSAFEGASAVFVISTLAPNEKRFVQQRNAIDAARRAGARTVLYTSALQRRGSVFAGTQGHVDTEQYLECTTGSYTVVRNGHYIENLPMFVAGSVESGELLLPQDGPTSWVSREDLGDAIARLLLEDFSGRRSLCLTGPTAMTFDTVAAIASRATGRTIARRTISSNDYVELLVSRGFVRPLAGLLATGFESRAAGELALVDPALPNILGRPARSVEEVLPRLLGRSRA